MRAGSLVLGMMFALGCGSSDLDDGAGGAGGAQTVGGFTSKGSGASTKGVGQSGVGQSGVAQSGVSVQNSGVGPTTGQNSAVVSVAQSSGFVSAITTGVTSGNPFGCDTGIPGDPGSFECDNCVGCAINGVCSNVYNGCFSNMQCSSFVGCLESCSDDQCFVACQMQYPQGALFYQSIITCVACDVCPVNCDEQQWGCQ